MFGSEVNNNTDSYRADSPIHKRQDSFEALLAEVNSLLEQNYLVQADEASMSKEKPGFVVNLTHNVHTEDTRDALVKQATPTHIRYITELANKLSNEFLQFAANRIYHITKIGFPLETVSSKPAFTKKWNNNLRVFTRDCGINCILPDTFKIDMKEGNYNLPFLVAKYLIEYFEDLHTIASRVLKYTCENLTNVEKFSNESEKILAARGDSVRSEIIDFLKMTEEDYKSKVFKSSENSEDNMKTAYMSYHDNNSTLDNVLQSKNNFNRFTEILPLTSSVNQEKNIAAGDSELEVGQGIRKSKDLNNKIAQWLQKHCCELRMMMDSARKCRKNVSELMLVMNQTHTAVDGSMSQLSMAEQDEIQECFINKENKMKKLQEDVMLAEKNKLKGILCSDVKECTLSSHKEFCQEDLINPQNSETQEKTLNMNKNYDTVGTICSNTHLKNTNAGSVNVIYASDKFKSSLSKVPTNYCSLCTDKFPETRESEPLEQIVVTDLKQYCNGLCNMLHKTEKCLSNITMFLSVIDGCLYYSNMENVDKEANITECVNSQILKSPGENINDCMKTTKDPEQYRKEDTKEVKISNSNNMSEKKVKRLCPCCKNPKTRLRETHQN